MYIRELVFEEVRREMFPSLPTRRTAMWLFDQRSSDFWINWFRRNPLRRQILTLSATGSIHVGNQQYLDSDLTSYQAYRENAQQYWSGSSTKNATNNEILFVGTFKVVSVSDHIS